MPAHMGARDPITEADDHLPLKPVVFHILLALGRADLHGYGVIQAVRDSSGGRVRVQPGPFYRHLRRLMDDGLVAEAPRRPAGDDPRRGAYYRLTPLGEAVLQAEADRLSILVAATRGLGLTERDS